MSNCSKFCLELIDLFEDQKLLLERKDKLIAKLINENLEKENMIDVLMNEFELEP